MDSTGSNMEREGLRARRVEEWMGDSLKEKKAKKNLGGGTRGR